jgi:F-type H+-transporting ATPase subunit b
LRKLAGVMALAAFVMAAASSSAFAQQAPAAPAATPSHDAQTHTPAEAKPGHATPSHTEPGHETAEAHDESPWSLIARLFNFLVLAGGLFYLLRKPLARHLTGRSRQIRGDLVTARETVDRASTQIAEIDRKLKELPAELAALRARGEEEIVGVRSRIEELARTERERLLEQTRREIELQVRLAKRDLAEHAASLAVELARGRLESAVTPRDHERLVDRYIAQVRSAGE